MDTDNHKPLSDAQLKANRANAKHSTGPKTGEGKQRSSRNSFKHGLTGQIHIATLEEMATYQAFCQEYFDEWKPTGPTEKGMVQDLADTRWQINRAAALIGNIHPDDTGELTVEQSRQLDQYSRHGSRYRRDFERTLNQLKEHQKERRIQKHADLREAGHIADLYSMLGEPWDPPRYGFVWTIQEIDTYRRRRNVILDSMTAMNLDYNKEEFQKQMAKNIY